MREVVDRDDGCLGSGRLAVTVKSWKLIDSEYLLKRPGVAVRVDRVETKNGQVFEPYVIESGTWVNVIALTEKREVVLIRQYRHAVGQILLELPAGLVDEGDSSPLAGAQRELLEETGYAGKRFIEIGHVYPNPATHTNLIYSYLALDARLVGEQNLEETEDIEVQLLPWEQVLSLAKSGGLPQALHVCAVFFAQDYLEKNPASYGAQ
jgi:ADP-ribose pyrophosphatase